MAFSGLNVMDKPCITRFFTQKGKVLDFEIQRANYRLFGAIDLTSGQFKLEHCSFDLPEAIEELRVVRSIFFSVNSN